MAYVANRYVDSRLRNEAVEDGLYSEVEGGVIESGVAETFEAGLGTRDLGVLRDRMAARCGADLERNSSLEVAGLDEDGTVE